MMRRRRVMHFERKTYQSILHSGASRVPAGCLLGEVSKCSSAELQRRTTSVWLATHGWGYYHTDRLLGLVGGSVHMLSDANIVHSTVELNPRAQRHLAT